MKEAVQSETAVTTTKLQPRPAESSPQEEPSEPRSPAQSEYGNTYNDMSRSRLSWKCLSRRVYNSGGHRTPPAHRNGIRLCDASGSIDVAATMGGKAGQKCSRVGVRHHCDLACSGQARVPLDIGRVHVLSAAVSIPDADPVRGLAKGRACNSTIALHTWKNEFIVKSQLSQM